MEVNLVDLEMITFKKACQLIETNVKTNDKNGIVDFMNILRKMISFGIIEFDVNDIVRSGLVKEYIVAKLQSGM